MTPRLCFFAPVSDLAVLERTGFYRQDLDILRRIDPGLAIATGWRNMPRDCDLYFVWWWTWAFKPAAMAMLRRRPMVVTGVLDVYSPIPSQAFETRPRWQRALIQWVLGRADGNVFISEYERDWAARRFRPDAQHYVPLGIDVARYAPSAAPRERVMATVAWLHGPNVERKGLPSIVRAMPAILAAHPDVRFVVAGERGSGYPRLQALADELGVSHAIRFPGVISEDEKIRLMQTCAVYLQPSRHEGFGLAVLEAMACGAPVVSTRVGAVPEVVGDAGVLIAESTPEQVAAAALRLLDDPAGAAALGARARARAVEVFPLERRAREIGALVRACVERRR